MKNKKCLLSTVFSGYNYGSSLQALAGKSILNNLGYNCQLVAMKSLVKGRDIRLKKFFTILIRSLLLYDKNGSKVWSTYQSSYAKVMIGDSVSRFTTFSDRYLKPSFLSWNALKKAANESIACFAGSDQIWNSAAMYVDPIYYLRFAPAEKRVALAPSFGRDFVADYNKKKMSKWISDFAYLSVREDSGVKLIKTITGKDAVQLIDPTLILDRESWVRILDIKLQKKNYVLTYFLDKPSDFAKKAILDLKVTLNAEVIAIPYQFDDMSYCDRVVAAGPKEFVELIVNAKFVCTDSFHGTAFSINMHTPFFVFEREYGSANKQSERILSILRKVNMLNRYQPISVVENMNVVDFEYAENILGQEREKAYRYINNAITEIRKHEK